MKIDAIRKFVFKTFALIWFITGIILVIARSDGPTAPPSGDVSKQGNYLPSTKSGIIRGFGSKLPALQNQNGMSRIFTGKFFTEIPENVPLMEFPKPNVFITPASTPNSQRRN